MIMGVHSLPHACCSYQLTRRAFIQHGRADYASYPIQDENSVYSFHLPYYIRISDLRYEDELSAYSQKSVFFFAEPNFNIIGFIFVPDLFPGAVYRMKKPAVAMLIFESGSVMILGVREKSDLTVALTNMISILDKYKYIPDVTTSRAAASRKRPRTAEEKQNAALFKAAFKTVRHMPVRNSSEFEQYIKEEMERLRNKRGKKRGRKTTRKATPQPPFVPMSLAPKILLPTMVTQDEFEVVEILEQSNIMVK